MMEMKQLAQKIAVFLLFGVILAAFGPRGLEAREVQLVMALDISGSMKTTDPLRLLPKSAHIMVELLDVKDRLGVLTFEDVAQTRLVCAPLNAAQRHKGVQELKRLQPRGLYTDLYQALAQGLKCFGPPGQAKRALLLISDGQMDINPHKGNSKTFVERVHQEIIPAYKKAGIPIYTVAFTAASDQALLKTLADQTGGRFLLIPTAKDLHRAFTKFYEDLKGPQVAPLVGNHFVIDPQVKEAILVATRSKQDRPIGLETPQKKKIGPASKGVRWFSAPTFDMVTLPSPKPGQWTVSGLKEGDGKVILMTDLKLDCPHLPKEAGLDEALVAGALLTNKGLLVDTPEVLTETVFTAELQAEGGQAVKLPLGPLPPGQKDLWPPGTRVVKFPPFGSAGTWNLTIRALGKTFQRERNLSFKVSQPWYKAQQIIAGGQSQVEFQPNPDLKAEQLAGWISLDAPAAGVSGKFVDPPPGHSFRFLLPAGLSSPCQVNLELTGVTNSGRPLIIQSPPLPLNLDPGVLTAAMKARSAAAVPENNLAGTAAAAEKGAKGGAAVAATAAKNSSAADSSLFSKESIRKHKWLWLAGLGLLAAIIILVAVAYIFKPPVLQFLIIKSSRRAPVDEDEMDPEKLNLLLKAQVESLLKEKGKLIADLGEMRQLVEQLMAAKEELEAKMGEPSSEFREKSKVIKELESRLEEAEREAKSVQEEYMALYARSNQEKQELKKT